MGMDPTEEQVKAIDAFKTGGSLAIEAGAGTGKTSTLVMLSKAAGTKQGQYVAFNKALVEESRAKFPLSVGCNTAHSLAFRAVGKNYAPRLNRSERMRGSDMASKLGIGFLEVETFDFKPKSLYPGYLASQAAKTVTLFCQSADRVITAKHVPYMRGISPISQMQVREYLVPFALQMWADLQQPYGWVPFKHEHYLKMWHLDDPAINADYILFDEAQDANPVIADIVAQQEIFGTQLVYVGDSQQEIYAWTGAVNALGSVKAANRTFLTQSFRFGQAVADRANAVLDVLDAELRLTGNPAIESRLEELDSPRAILTRTNATGVASLLKYQEQGRLAHMIGGADAPLAFARGANDLILTGRSSHPDLTCFDSWNAVTEYVKGDDGGEDLRMLVKLVNEFGAEEIISGLENMPTEQRAEVVISTAHKSKGREWHSVKLSNDFPMQADSDPSDLRLLYVAITRAKVVLDDTALMVDKEAVEVVDG